MFDTGIDFTFYCHNFTAQILIRENVIGRNRYSINNSKFYPSQFSSDSTLKGTVAPDFLGSFFGLYEKEPLLVLNFSVAPSIFGRHLKFWSVSYQKIMENLVISEMDIQMWAMVLGDFLFLSWRTADNVKICLGDEFTISQSYWRNAYKCGGFLHNCLHSTPAVFQEMFGPLTDFSNL